MPKNLQVQEKSLYLSNLILDAYPNIAVIQPNTVLAVIKLGHCSASTKVIFQGPGKMQENKTEEKFIWIIL